MGIEGFIKVGLTMAALIYIASVIFIVEGYREREIDKTEASYLSLIMISLLVFFGAFCYSHGVFGRDLDRRYADSLLKPWFDSLRSGKGPCCSDADGTALVDADWETNDQHYRVRIGGEWYDVPDDAVLKEPNRFGRAIVWPVMYQGRMLSIRCFIPGALM